MVGHDRVHDLHEQLRREQRDGRPPHVVADSREPSGMQDPADGDRTQRDRGEDERTMLDEYS
jgi:hypothetical protein